MFYERYAELCKKRGLSPSRGLQELGLSSGNLINWKNGRLPKTEVLNKIARFFDVPLDYLLGDSQREKAFLAAALWGADAEWADEELLEDVMDYAALLMEKKKRKNSR